ncbi:MAG: diguanylate cyclase, partial [Woeseiaceae bacterium]|nr:diguanylate cyclase [Woeseiaceae bacterium]
MNGSHSISIAVLSRNQDDVELINSTLRDAGLAAYCHWVQTARKLEDTLFDQRVELIILNCDSFDESIRGATKLKDKVNPEVPVIGIAVKADEKAIQEAMRQGAVDLVSINMKQRLTAVVSRELRALRAERALNSTIASATEYKKQIRDFMKASPAAVALVQEGIVVEANDAWLKLFKAASADEVCGLPLMDSFDAQNHAALKGALVATIAGKWKKEQTLEAKAHIDGADGDALHLEFLKVDFDGAPTVQIRIKQSDKPVEPTKLVHDALQRDPTTLLFHRQQLLERIQKRLKRKPKSGLHVLAYVKLDNFGELANKIGIIDSEELLAQFSEELRRRMHPRDVAGRFEGTSILVLLERGSARDGQVWGKQLTRHIEKKTFEVGDKSTHMTCTVGVCAVSDVFGSLEELVAATVDAYRLGKEAGGNTAFLNEEAHVDTKQKEFDAIWVKHLKAALMEKRFRLAQLPIAGLRSDSIEMYDLLVRMLDEQGNSVLPSEFLPAAERNNMMKTIDRYVIKAAMDFCTSHDADRVFVRLSRQSIVDST